MGDEFPVYSRKPVVALCSSTTLSGIFGASPDLRYVCPENVPSFASVYSDAEKCTAFTDFLDNSSADFAAVELIPDELCSRMDEKTLNEAIIEYQTYAIIRDTITLKTRDIRVQEGIWGNTRERRWESQ